MGRQVQLPNPGDQIGRYVLDECLGRGASGVAFKATDTFLNAPVCIKVLHPSISKEPELMARMKREVLLARRISHPGICSVFDVHQEEGLNFISMDLIEGDPLHEVIQEAGGSLSVVRSLRIVASLSSAVGAAHEAGVIHRDLKPQNVIIKRGTDQAIILDFGVAFSSGMSALTSPGIALGTLHWISPEVWRGETATAQSDIFALGVILYNSLTGRTPLATRNPNERLEIMQAGLPAPGTRHDGIPKSVDALFAKATAYELGDRYASAAELSKDADALADELEKEPSGAPAPVLVAAPAEPPAATVVDVDNPLDAQSGLNSIEIDSDLYKPEGATGGKNTPTPAMSVPLNPAELEPTLPPMVHDRSAVSVSAGRPLGDVEGQVQAKVIRLDQDKTQIVHNITWPSSNGAAELPPTDPHLSGDSFKTDPDLSPDVTDPQAAPPGDEAIVSDAPLPDDESFILSGEAQARLMTRMASHRQEHGNPAAPVGPPPKPKAIPRSRAVLASLAVGLAAAVAAAIVWLALSTGPDGAAQPEGIAGSELVAGAEDVNLDEEPGAEDPSAEDPSAEDPSAEDPSAGNASAADDGVQPRPGGEDSSAGATGAPADDTNVVEASASEPSASEPSAAEPGASEPTAVQRPAPAHQAAPEPAKPPPPKAKPAAKPSAKQLAAKRAAERERQRKAKQRYSSALDRLTKQLKQRGFIAGDAPAVSQRLGRGKKAARRGAYVSALGHVEDAERALGKQKVDKAFIERKLKRFNVVYDRIKDPGTLERVRPLMGKVLGQMSKKQYEQANRSLNRAFAIAR